MADDGLKRVGLVFKADGSADFTKSLKDVNAAVSENRSAFKLAKSEWTDSTTAMQKLRDTQEYLTQQTEAYSDKVKRLQEILNTQESAEKRNEAAITKTKDQLNNAKASLNNYQKGLEDVEKKLKDGSAQLEEYAKKVEATGNKATEAGKTLSKGLTAPIVATGTAAGIAWKEIDEAYDNIAAGTGATGDALQGLQDSFNNVYGSFPDDSQSVSSSIADINTRFGFTDESLENCSKKFLEFAQVNKTDVSTAIQDVSRYMGDASIESSQYSTVLDSLTAASQSSGIEVNKLSEDLTKYGAPMRALGLETQESIALFSQWEKAGVNTETAFSGMKKAISNWSASGKDARVEFKNTLDQIAAAPDIASATTMAIETFGAKAGPDLADAIQGGRFSVEEFLKTVQASGGQLDASFNAMQDGPDQAKVALNNLKLAGADLSSTALTTFGPVITQCVNKIKEFTEWFRGLNDGQKNTIITIGLLLATIGPLLILFGKTASGISSIIKLGKDIAPVLSLVKSGIAGINTTMFASPITWIIAGITAVIAIFVLLYTKCEWFRNGVNGIISAIVSGVKSAIDHIMSFFSGIFDFISGIVDKIRQIFGTISKPFIDAIDGIKNAWNWLKDAIKLPHFNIEGSFSLAPPRVPKLGIEWYANGGILNSPTIFGMNGGNMMGGGEAGPEAVLPISNLIEYMRQANSESNQSLINALAQILPAAFIQALASDEGKPIFNLYFNGKMLTKDVANKVLKIISKKEANKLAVKGA